MPASVMVLATGILLLGTVVLGSPLAVRQESITDDDLFASCPGGPGSPRVERADRYVLKTPVRQPDELRWSTFGSVQMNCGGGTDPSTWTIGGKRVFTTTLSIHASLGISIGSISIGSSIDTSETNSIETSESVEVTIPPGRQAVRKVGVTFHVYASNIQVNYPDRQFGHYEWYSRAVVTKAYPVAGDLRYDTQFSDCGSDPHIINP